MFFAAFEDDLKAHDLEPLLAVARQSSFEEPSVDFSALASALALAERLPARLLAALLTLEAAASPEKSALSRTAFCAESHASAFQATALSIAPWNSGSSPNSPHPSRMARPPFLRHPLSSVHLN